MTKKDTMLNLGMGGIIGLNVVGAMPIGGSASEATLRTNFATGVGHTGKALPVMGKVKGTKMVMKGLKKLKPIKFKGAYNL